MNPYAFGLFISPISILVISLGIADYRRKDDDE